MTKIITEDIPAELPVLPLRNMVILVYAGRKQRLLRNIKTELADAKVAAGAIQINPTRKYKKHKDKCPRVWIYEESQPQTFSDLKFVRTSP